MYLYFHEQRSWERWLSTPRVQCHRARRTPGKVEYDKKRATVLRRDRRLERKKEKKVEAEKQENKAPVQKYAEQKEKGGLV